MHRHRYSTSLILAAAAVATGCAKPEPPQQAARASGPRWAVVVLYNQPKDTAAFERYYAQSHMPLVRAGQQEMGYTDAVVVKFARNLDGSTPAIYRKGELWFDSEAALTKGLATPAFKKIGDDLKNFATGGLTALVSVETNK
jgi:uncharacterized protein (TIGR02118 family)